MRQLAVILMLTALPVSATVADETARANYLLACRGCHLADGSGVPPDVPSLRNTLGQFAASPEGRGYLVRVPGVLQSRLNDEQLADVINWVLTEFNADTLPGNFRPLSADEVGDARQQILANPEEYRNSLVRDSAVE